MDGSLSLDFVSRLNFNCLKSFLAVSLFTVADGSFELQDDHLNLTSRAKLIKSSITNVRDKMIPTLYMVAREAQS